MMSPADHIAQLECVVRDQITEIDRLRAVIDQRDAEIGALVDWIASDEGALGALRAVYVDPRSSPATKVKAASAAIGFEIARPPSASIVGTFSLYEALERPQKPITIEHESSLASDRAGEALTGPEEP
jgi:hypothetical protein